jgi:hypothetical protein
VFHGRYEVVRCIRAGGIGAVYEVIQGETRRRRALKTMLPSLVQDADLKARLRAEATVTAEIESEHVVEVFDAGVAPATSMPFLAMELLSAHPAPPRPCGALVVRFPARGRKPGANAGRTPGQRPRSGETSPRRPAHGMRYAR